LHDVKNGSGTLFFSDFMQKISSFSFGSDIKKAKKGTRKLFHLSEKLVFLNHLSWMNIICHGWVLSAIKYKSSAADELQNKFSCVRVAQNFQTVG
jgi:hypothetical protein